MKRTLLGLTALALSCSTATVVNTTYNFDRATDVAFLCLRAENGAVTALPLESCGLNPGDSTSASGSAHLYAVVTQSERGELAVVDLAAASGTSLIDNSPELPGYSFIPIGALPSAVVSDPRASGTPSSVWIASAGARAIERVDAATVLFNPRRAAAGREVLRASTPIPMNGAPRDLAIDTVDGRTYLYATVPDRSAVAAFDVTDPLHPVDMGFTPITAPAGSDAGLDGGAPTPAHPLALSVGEHRVYVSDDQSNYVHVLAEGPLREVERLDVGAPTRALAISGWARRLTCAAEATDPDHYAHARYLYAAHATTGALLVYDLQRHARVRANLLPSPNPQRRTLDPSLTVDQVAISTPVVSLVPINTKEYSGPNAMGDITVPAACGTTAGCAGSAAVGPTYLHGVFMGAVLRDGHITVIDIDDYDAPARAQSTNVVDGTNGYRFVRHAPRASIALTTTGLTVSAPVHTTIVRETQRIQVAEASTTPALGCVRPRAANDPLSCLVGGPAVVNHGIELAPRAPVPTAFVPGASNAPSMPAEPTCDPLDAGVLDASSGVAALPADPYSLRNEVWTLTYEGVIPGLDLYGVGFSAGADGRIVLDAPAANFCTRGAVAEGPLPAPGAYDVMHDVVVLVGNPTALAANLTACNQRFGTTTPVNREFVIAEARQDQLVLDASNGVTLDDLRRCFPLAAHAQVRTRNQWLVTGTRNGYLGAVRADATGRCVIDEAKQSAVDALSRACLTSRVPVADRTGQRCLAGRACMGAPRGTVSLAATPVFANPFFCFQVFPSVVSETSRDAQFTFSIAGAWEPLRLEAGSFPVSARFIPKENRLFVVDTQSLGLIEYRIDPLAPSRRFN